MVPAALAAGIGAAAVMAALPGPAGGAEIAASLVVGWSFVASGLVAWERRPADPTGKVMVATGFAWFAHELMWAAEPLPWTVGQLLESAYMLGAGFLLVTFPDGRLRGLAERCIMAVAVLVVGPLQLAWMLLGYGDDPGCACPENLLQVADARACRRRSSTCSRAWPPRSRSPASRWWPGAGARLRPAAATPSRPCWSRARSRSPW